MYSQLSEAENDRFETLNWPKGYRTFFHSQLTMKFIQPINVKLDLLAFLNLLAG